MRIDRRGLVGAGFAALAAQAARAQPAPPSLADRITEAATRARHRLAYDGRTFSGPAWELLVREGAQAQFFLFGGEHGIAENPALAAQLFRALAPAGRSTPGRCGPCSPRPAPGRPTRS